MTQRQITLINNSTVPTALAVLQNPAEHGSLVVAWLAKYAYPGTQVRFTWDDADFCFVWSGTGQLSPGVVVDAAQIVPADPQQNNRITLSYDGQNRTFRLHDPQDGSPPGSLSVVQDTSIPMNAVATGIGMAGKPSVVTQAMPNMISMFTPRPGYYLAFGNLVQGQLLDLSTMAQVQPVEFPPNVYALTATLGPDNQWTVVSDILTTADTDA
ncbi:hypothetical protein [Tahibacter caeni]|uniref:hypothetical protein n=1 Tax=Tahibacter caeni TaxID=1453545 RepID=UPI00214779E7|nr:hypothetical protein [Tahibacter caeni]